jgi:hypothetical protein
MGLSDSIPNKRISTLHSGQSISGSIFDMSLMAAPLRLLFGVKGCSCG